MIYLWFLYLSENRPVWRPQVLLPTLYVRGRHWEYSPCVSRLSGHHTTDAPSPIRAPLISDRFPPEWNARGWGGDDASFSQRRTPKRLSRSVMVRLTVLMYPTCLCPCSLLGWKQTMVSRVDIPSPSSVTRRHTCDHTKEKTTALLIRRLRSTVKIALIFCFILLFTSACIVQ